MTVRWCVPAVMIVALASACGGSSKPAASSASASPTPSTASSGTTKDPCSLVSNADVNTAIHATIDPPKSTTSGPPLSAHHCLWATTTVPVRTFQITLQSNSDITVQGETTRVLFDQIKTTLGATQHLVAGTVGGAEALIGTSFVYVLKGDVLLTADVGFGTSATAHAALLDLSAKAAAAL